jgi:hypothetical protein
MVNSGYVPYRSSRPQSFLDDIPIVVISEADPTVEMPRARKLGFSGHIGRPINAACFARQIHNAISGTEI